MNPIPNKIKNRLVSGKNSEQRLILHLKLLCLLTVISSIVLFLSTNFIIYDPIYSRLCLMVGTFYLVMFLLLQFNSRSWYKIYFSVVMPIWVFIVELYIGDNSFGHGILTVSFVVTSFLFFQNQPFVRKIILVYTLLMYFSSSLYTNYYGGLHSFNNPYDESIIFLNCLIWIIIIFSYYEHKMESYITTLTSYNKELRQNKNELERFNYMASHDLKTPLRTITSFLGLINRDIKKENYSDIKEYSYYANSGVKQIQELIEGVVEISRIKTDFKEQELEVIDLNNVLKRVKRILINRFEGKEYVITSVLLPTVKGVYTDFEILFQEIIENGIQYNNSLIPEVRISFKQNKNEIAILFEDNGIGIAKPYHDQIFQFFKRLHSVKDYPGTGLGLGLCRKIIDKYDGRIDVESDYDTSATFFIKLPATVLEGNAKPKQQEQVVRV